MRNNMISGNLKRSLLLLVFVLTFITLSGQGGVPLGIHYQAVARDNYGKELASKKIDVRFSIVSGNPLGTIVFQELHSGVITSKYGVFSLIIGNGILTGGTFGELSQIEWNTAYHYLKVEVKFENDYVDMGTMQFLAVPYALFAQKSLEPGPRGPKGDTGPQGTQGMQGLKGDQGDPASDDQVLSFNGNNLSISGGNVVNLSTLSLPHQLSILGDTLSILGGNKVLLRNQIQDLSLDVNNKLKISNNPSAEEIDLTKYLDDKQQLSLNPLDNTLSITNGISTVNLAKFDQILSFNSSNNSLSISGGSLPVDLTPLKNDADADPVNEIQDLNLSGNNLTITKNQASAGISLNKFDNGTLTYNPENYQLSVSNGNSIPIGSIIAFRAGINANYSIPTNSYFDLVFDQITGNYYSDGLYYNASTGIFKADNSGIYTFNVSTSLPANFSVILEVMGSPYETIIGPVASGGNFRESITLKLNKDDTVNVAVYQNNGYTIPYTFVGSFAGFRIY